MGWTTSGRQSHPEADPANPSQNQLAGETIRRDDNPMASIYPAVRLGASCAPRNKTVAVP